MSIVSSFAVHASLPSTSFDHEESYDADSVGDVGDDYGKMKLFFTRLLA